MLCKKKKINVTHISILSCQVSLRVEVTGREINFRFLLNKPNSDYIDQFPIDVEANGIVVWNSKLSTCYLLIDTL